MSTTVWAFIVFLGVIAGSMLGWAQGYLHGYKNGVRTREREYEDMLLAAVKRSAEQRMIDKLAAEEATRDATAAAIRDAFKPLPDRYGP